MPQVDDEDDDGLSPRRDLPQGKRIELLERDHRGLARSYSRFVDNNKTFSHEQLEQLRGLLREEFADAGIRLDGPDHIEEARADFRFIRRVRKGVDGYASKIGWFVIAAILAGAVWLFTLGMNTWKGGP
jgi:hypothetical protein